jgi:hypothetical protein
MKVAEKRIQTNFNRLVSHGLCALLIFASTMCFGTTTGFWIPYTATPVPGSTGGKTGLFVISSNALESSPAPKWVATTPSQLLGIALQYTFSGGITTYTPDLMMYAAAGSDGKTHVYGLNLSNTAEVPVPTQISSLSLPSTKQICSSNQAETNLATPKTLFVVLEITAVGQCNLGGETFEVVSYEDSATTAPTVADITSNQFDSLYNGADLEGTVLFDSATKALNLYKGASFVAPTLLVSGIEAVFPIVTASINSGTEFDSSAVFMSVITASGTEEQYRIDSAGTATKFHTGLVGSSAVDNKNLYFADVTSPTTTKIYQEPLSGGTAKLLYSGPSPTGSAYQLIGTNDSVLVFQLYKGTSVTDATATLYTVPIGVASTTPTKIGAYDGVLSAFLASPSASDPSGNVLFVTVMKVTGSGNSTTTSYTAFAILPGDPTKQNEVKNAVYESFGILTSELTGSVWQVRGITDTDGGWGGGTVSHVDVSTLVSTDFKTTGGSVYKMPANYDGFLEAFSSDNIAAGTLLHERSASFPKAATFGVAADLSEDFLLPIEIANTNVSAF